MPSHKLLYFGSEYIEWKKRDFETVKEVQEVIKDLKRIIRNFEIILERERKELKYMKLK